LDITLTRPLSPKKYSENFILGLFVAQEGDAPVSVKLIRNQGTQPGGYAFLEFSSHNDAKRVLATYNGSQIPGSHAFFRLNWSSGSKKTAPNAFVSDSLFVGDLSSDIKVSYLSFIIVHPRIVFC